LITIMLLESNSKITKRNLKIISFLFIRIKLRKIVAQEVNRSKRFNRIRTAKILANSRHKENL
jgi:hypothetical protein